MATEPRRLPDYGVQIIPANWYCLHCNQWRQTSGTINAHLIQTHGISGDDRQRGIDFLQGSEVMLATLERQLWERDQPERFALALDSLRGAEDFAFEVGDGAAVEKGDWRAKP